MIENIFGADNLPYFLRKNTTGQLVILTCITVNIFQIKTYPTISRYVLYFLYLLQLS